MQLLDCCDDILQLIAEHLLCIRGNGPYSVPKLSLSCSRYRHILVNSNSLLKKAKEAARLTWIATYTWHVQKFSSINSYKLCSEEFRDDQDNLWRLLLFPRGSDITGEYLSLYLQSMNGITIQIFNGSRIAEMKSAGSVDRNVFCVFTLHNVNPSKTINRRTGCTFDKDCNAWGIPNYMKYNNESPTLFDITAPHSGWLIDDVLTISAQVTTRLSSQPHHDLPPPPPPPSPIVQNCP